MAAEVQYATHKAPNGGPALSYALHLPADSSAVAKAALIAHPYGRLGGCKEDHVVVALAEMLAREGYAVSGRFTAALRDLVRRGGSCVLTVFGDADNFSSVDKLRSWAAGLEKEQGSDSCWTAVEVEGVDHFWREREKKRALLDVVRRWLREEQ
ncbi:hypothetical protein JCM10213v2_001185 [Rhodosporidiobolus nylandii]